MGLPLLFQGLFQQEYIPPTAYAKTSTVKAPVYKRSLNPVSGTLLALGSGLTGTIAQFTTTRRTLIKGYVASGEGDGQFWVNIGGTKYFYTRTNAVRVVSTYRTPDEDEPYMVDSAVLIQLQVTNLATSAVDYWGTLELV